MTNVCDIIDPFLEIKTMKKTNYVDISITDLHQKQINKKKNNSFDCVVIPPLISIFI